MSHTISIDVNSTSISFTIVVRVSLSRVGLIWAIITPIPNSILIVVILPRVVHKWTVVLKKLNRQVHIFTWLVQRIVYSFVIFLVSISLLLSNCSKPLPVHPQFHHCHHLYHRHLPGHHCQGPLDQSWEVLGSYPKIIIKINNTDIDK